MDRKVLIFTTTYGHLSLAKALAQEFSQNNWKVKMHQQELRGMEIGYNTIYLFFPESWKYFYQIFNARRLQGMLKRLNKAICPKEVIKEIKKFKPHLIVSTNCLLNLPLEKNKKKYGYKLTSIVADPRTPFNYYFSPNIDLHFVYDQKLKKQLKSEGIADKQIVVAGWPVRKDFYLLKPPKNKISQGPIKILIIAGSVGTCALLRFLPVFKKYQKELRLTIVAGSSRVFYQTLKSYRKINGLKYKLYGFTNNLPKLINQNNLVAGKAGPNTLFETIAGGKPFLALTYLKGQETGNLEIIKENNLGWVALKPKALENLLAKFSANPRLIEKKIPFVLKERKRNQKATLKIVKTCQKVSGL